MSIEKRVYYKLGTKYKIRKNISLKLNVKVYAACASSDMASTVRWIFAMLSTERKTVTSCEISLKKNLC